MLKRQDEEEVSNKKSFSAREREREDVVTPNAAGRYIYRLYMRGTLRAFNGSRPPQNLCAHTHYSGG